MLVDPLKNQQMDTNMTATINLVESPASLPEHRRSVPFRLLLCLRGVEAVVLLEAAAAAAAALEELFQGLLRIIMYCDRMCDSCLFVCHLQVLLLSAS